MSEKKFSVIRSWEVEAETTSEAIKKTKNWDHICVNTKRIVNCKSIVPSVENSIPVEDILKDVLKYLHAIQKWVDSKHFQTADIYFNRVITLLVLVETYDCGHTGGYGEGQRTSKNCAKYEDIYHSIFARFLWLYEKYVACETTDSLPSEIGVKLSDFWRRLISLK